MTIALTGQAAAQQTRAAPVAKAGEIGADFTMFLRLLTTQMQNQDPLDPMKTNEYTQQLAQYTQIEQTVQQSTTLKEILARLSTQDMAQASGMIGREVAFDSAVAGLGTEPASWRFEGNRKIESATATITDSTGKIVDTRILTVNTASGSFDWNGSMENGRSALPGRYNLSLAARDSSGQNVPVTISSVGTVENVTQNGAALMLGVNGIDMPMSSLRRIATAI